MRTDLQFKYDFGINNKNYDNTAELNLPIANPLKFNFDFSFADINMNLNNIQISSFNFDLGIGSANVDFGDKYIYDCDFLTIDVGMGSADFTNFEKLYCEEYEIDCGMGSTIINFLSLLKKNQNIDLSIGMGLIKINILEGNNLKLVINQSMLSNLNFEKMDLIKTNVYRNENYNKSKATIQINASVGLGELSINWVK